MNWQSVGRIRCPLAARPPPTSEAETYTQLEGRRRGRGEGVPVVGINRARCCNAAPVHVSRSADRHGRCDCVRQVGKAHRKHNAPAASRSGSKRGGSALPAARVRLPSAGWLKVSNCSHCGTETLSGGRNLKLIRERTGCRRLLGSATPGPKAMVPQHIHGLAFANVHQRAMNRRPARAESSEPQRRPTARMQAKSWRAKAPSPVDDDALWCTQASRHVSSTSARCDNDTRQRVDGQWRGPDSSGNC